MYLTGLAPRPVGANAGHLHRVTTLPMASHSPVSCSHCSCCEPDACSATCEVQHLEIVVSDMMTSLPSSSRRPILSQTVPAEGRQAYKSQYCALYTPFSGCHLQQQVICPPPQCVATSECRLHCNDIDHIALRPRGVEKLLCMSGALRMVLWIPVFVCMRDNAVEKQEVGHQAIQPGCNQWHPLEHLCSSGVLTLVVFLAPGKVIAAIFNSTMPLSNFILRWGHCKKLTWWQPPTQYRKKRSYHCSVSSPQPTDNGGMLTKGSSNLELTLN